MTIQHLVVLFLFSSLVFGVDGVNILSATHQVFHILIVNVLFGYNISHRYLQRKLVDSLNDRLELVNLQKYYSQYFNMRVGNIRSRV